MYYFIVRKSDNTYYCGTFTLSGFTSDWMDSSFYDDEVSAKKIADSISAHYNESFSVEKAA
jgi:hypothetical protein